MIHWHKIVPIVVCFLCVVLNAYHVYSSNLDQGEGWTNEPTPIIWESTFTTTPPVIDGTLEDPWQSAKSITVNVREALGGDHPKEVTLRALHTNDSLFIAAQWSDATKSDMRDPYVWNTDNGSYDRPSKPDDQFAIEFPMRGDFGISMLTIMREFTADVWHWKAGRGNSIGWVDDKYHLISKKPIHHEKAKKHLLHGGRTVYILRAQDQGQSSYLEIPKPVNKRQPIIDSFEQQEPTGSLADIRGKGVYGGSGWTLEMSRKFNTGHPEDDAVIDISADNPCAIAVLDDELFEEHSVSTIITLKFVGGPGK